jgi:hypothetical protein
MIITYAHLDDADYQKHREGIRGDPVLSIPATVFIETIAFAKQRKSARASNKLLVVKHANILEILPSIHLCLLQGHYYIKYHPTRSPGTQTPMRSLSRKLRSEGWEGEIEIACETLRPGDLINVAEREADDEDVSSAA